MTSRSNKQAVNVSIKIVIKKYKKEEFLECMHMYRKKIRKQPFCLGYDLYQDLVEENTYMLVGEWKTAKAMEKHFQSHEYELLLGATKVLGDTLEIKITKVLHIGDFNWARGQIKQRRNIFENRIQ